MLVINLIMRPVRTLVVLTRFVAFVFAAVTWVALIFTLNDETEPVGIDFWALAIGFTLVCLLTFIHRKQRIHVHHTHVHHMAGPAPYVNDDDAQDSYTPSR